MAITWMDETRRVKSRGEGEAFVRNCQQRRYVPTAVTRFYSDDVRERYYC